MRYAPAPTLLAIAIAAAPSILCAADPEYSVFVLPADTGKVAFVNGIEGSALSPDGKRAILKTWDNSDNPKSYSWSFGATSVSALTLSGFPNMEFYAVTNSGLAVGEIYDNTDEWAIGFPASASAGFVTKRGTQRGNFNDQNDAGTLTVGPLWPTPPATNATALYSGVRARKWTGVGGGAVNVLTGTSKANAPAAANRVSSNATWIAGLLPNPVDLTAKAFIKNSSTDSEPVVIDAPFLSPEEHYPSVVANDGTAVLHWGHEDIGFENEYLWSGTALQEVIPSDQTYSSRDTLANVDQFLYPLGAWGQFAEVTGKGLVGVVDVKLDTTNVPNPNNTEAFRRFRWLASNGSLTCFATLLPTIGNSQSYVLETNDLTTNGQILANIRLPNASTQAAAILTPVPVVSVTANTLSKGEAGGIFAATVTRSAGPAGALNTNWPLTVNLSYIGKAVRGTDFNAPLTVTIPAGQVSATVIISITDDAIAEGPEAFTLRLVKPAPGSYTPQNLYRLSSAQNKLTYLITDNDSAVVSSDR